MITAKVLNGEMSPKEQEYYVEKMREQFPDIKNGTVEISIDGECVDCVLIESPVRFQRIRRITGYLVGTLDRFNNAKRSEVEDRVKHGVGGGGNA